MKKVIVSGANGFIGQWLVRELLNKEIEVYALVRSVGSLPLQHEKLHIIHCNMEHVIDAAALLKDEKIDTFYHLAWEGSTGAERADYHIQISNIKFACDALNVAKTVGCTRFFAAGTISERIIDDMNSMSDLSPNLLYGVCKKATHELLAVLAAQLNIKLVWLQFSNVFGPGNTTGNLISYTLNMISKGLRPEYSKATQPYDFIYIKDLVRAVVLLGESKLTYSNYFIGSGQPRSLKEYLLAIPKALNMEINMGIGLRKEDGITFKKEWFSIDELAQDTGFESRYVFEDAVKETYLNLKNTGEVKR